MRKNFPNSGCEREPCLPPRNKENKGNWIMEILNRMIPTPGLTEIQYRELLNENKGSLDKFTVMKVFSQVWG
jgi:hypothetical protein